jgi:nucleotide-binding universal stress UspA family protein
MSAPRRILAVLECRPSDDEVLERALAVAAESGGYLTLVVVPPRPWPVFTGPYCAPRVQRAELRAHAEDVLRRVRALVSPDVPLIAAVQEGAVDEVIARRVVAAAHDLVVCRRRRFHRWAPRPPAPVLSVAT